MLNKNINKTLFNSKFIKVEIKDGFFCVQEPWCNNEGVGILPYVLKDNEYYFLQLHNENNPAHKKDRVSEYSTITGGLENQQFYTTILNEMLEETGIDISENVIIDRFNYSFANKSSDKKWFLYAIDLTNLKLDITKTYYGKSGDGTEFEKGIHAKFVNSFTLAGSIDNISSSIWGKWDLIRRYKEKENKIFLKNVINPKKIKQGFNKKIDLSELFNKEYFDNKNWFGFPLHYAVDNGYFEITKWLLENGADINIKDENGCTPLQIAIASPNNNVNFIKFLLENGADINIKDENDNNLLDIAIKNDKIEVVKLLLIQPNIDIDIKNYYIQQLLFYSANNGHLDSFNALLENGADINIKDENGCTPLQIALKKGHFNYKIINLLLENDVDINIKDENGCTPLQIALKKGHFNYKIINLLLENDVDINIEDKDGCTALHYALKNQHTNWEIINLLLENDANPNIKDIFGINALHIAIKKRDIKMINLLIEYGADVNAQDKDGCTALHYALKNQHTNWEIINLLIEYGADVNAQDNEAFTALHYAIIANSDINLINLLIKKGTNINAQDKDGCTALHYALKNQHTNWEIINLLIEYGADVNAQDNEAFTALHYAIIANSDINLINLLIKKGTNINAQDKDGCTALHYALKNQHTNWEIINLFSENGVDIDIEDKNGCISLQIALKNNLEIVNLLIEKSTNINAQIPLQNEAKKSLNEQYNNLELLANIACKIEKVNEQYNNLELLANIACKIEKVNEQYNNLELLANIACKIEKVNEIKINNFENKNYKKHKPSWPKM